MTTQSRKERERQRHVYDILDAAAALVAEKGISNISMDEIARKADYGKGTLYNYFKNKDCLMWRLIDRTLSGFTEKFIAETGDLKTCRQMISRVIELSISILDSDPTIFELWEYIEVNLRHPEKDQQSRERLRGIIDFLQVFANMFQKGMERGEIRNSSPMMLSIILFSMIRSVYKSGKSGINTFSPEENISFISDLIFKKL